MYDSVVLLVAALLVAVAPADLAGRPIEAIRVEGAPDEESKGAAASVLGLRLEEPLDLSRVRLAIRRVALTGPWADVRIDAEEGDSGGVVLVVTLVPDVLIEEVAIDSELPHDRLRALAGIDAGMRFREDRLDAAVEAIRRGAGELGYPRAQVQVQVERRSAIARKLTFSVRPGPPVLLRTLLIEGDAALGRREIEALLGVATGAPFERLTVEQGLVKLRELLHGRRHLAAAARVASVEIDESAGRADVTLEVIAGPRYHVRFRGNALLSDAQLATVVNTAALDGVDAQALSRARGALEDLYRAAGFARASVDVADVPIVDPAQRRPHRPGSARPADDGAERAIEFRVREGERAVVTDVFVDGAGARPSAELAAEVWSVVEQARADLGLLQRVDVGDIEDLLGRGAGVRDAARPFEVSDEGIELLPRPFIGRKPVYLEGAFDEAARRLADLYRADGYLDVRVQGPTPSFSEDGRAITVRYVISEGPRITVAAVQFIDTRCGTQTTCEDSLPFPSLLDDITLVPGQPASFAVITNARARLERNLQNIGYPFARVSEAVRRLSDAPAADVVYTVDPGPRVTIGKVRVKGNERTRDLVVLDRVTLDEGDLYAVDQVEASRQRLARLGLFSFVSMELLDDDPNATTRDLLVIVKERPQFAVELGAGASVEDGPRAFLAGEVRNVAGFGVGVRGRGQLNYPRAFYELRYDPADPANPINRFAPEENALIDWGRFLEGQAVLGSELPKVYGIGWDTRLHVDTVAMREIRPAFTLNRGSVLVGVDTQPLPWLHVGPQVEGEVSDFDCPRDLRFGQSCGGGSIGLVRRRDAGFIRQTTYRLAGSVDLRDHPVRPRSGVWLSGVGDLALGSGTLRTSGEATEATAVTSDFFKLTGAASGYVPLSDSFVLAVSARVGNIFPFTGAYIPLFKRFYLGGTNSIRGFREDEILPADDAAWPAASRLPTDTKDYGLVNSRQSLGGTFLVNARSELRVALVGDVELGTFVDLGQLNEDVRTFSPTGFAAGAGFGVRYNTPVGPFVIDVGWKVIDGARQLPPLTSLERMNLHLSIGTF